MLSSAVPEYYNNNRIDSRPTDPQRRNVVRPAPACPPLARLVRAISHLAFGSDAAADAHGSRPRPLRAVFDSLSDHSFSGRINRGGSDRRMVGPWLLPPR